MSKDKLYLTITSEINHILNNITDLNQKLEKICQLLLEKIEYFSWVGFYFVNPNKSDELILGPFKGAETEHTLISFGAGVCGQVAKHKKTIIIQDVAKEKNYLSCNINVKSEIVVPLFKNNIFLGELDIDSHKFSPFTKEDQKHLEIVCELISHFL